MNALYGSELTDDATRSRASSAADAADRPVLQLEPLVDPVRGALAPDPRLLDAAERRHLGRDEPGVDPDDPVLQCLSDPVHAPEALRVEVGREPVRGVVR